MTLSANNQLNIIIQAGGRGSRLRHHTWNKPKCLVSVRGKPLIYHAFEYFKDANFIIIGDYLIEQLEKYFETNPPKVDWKIIKALGKGTLSGIDQALGLIEKNSPILLLWGDIIINDFPEVNELKAATVFSTSALTCRWSISSSGKLQEAPSSEKGIPGIFFFPSKNWLEGLPSEGEFVKWLSLTRSDYQVKEVNQIEELGDFSRIEDENERNGFCRFFNRVEINESTVLKSVVDEKYKNIHVDEINWYKEVNELGFRKVPKIFQYQPLIMERLIGEHLFNINDLNPREQRAVFADYIDSLLDLHQKNSVTTNIADVKSVYIGKTFDRVNSIIELIPYMNKSHITINGLKCRNFFHPANKSIFDDILSMLIPREFTPIHGDPTFSNTIVDRNLRVKFIDPRGYFAQSGIYGDPLYDFAKIYYSAIGGYDGFNRRKFKLYIDEETIEVIQDAPIYAGTASQIMFEYFPEEINKIQLIHALIWFSFSGYVKDDIDSIVGAYSLGNFWFEKALRTV